MSATTHLRKTPTENMLKALKNFGVSQTEIAEMNFDQASKKIGELKLKAFGKQDTPKIELASEKREVPLQAPQPKPTTQSYTLDEAIEEANDTMRISTERVMEFFNIKDKSELKEAHIALIQEVDRQIYALSHWVDKKG